MNPLTREKLVRLCEAQNWRCCYCGIPMEIGRPGDDTPTFEHVVPKIAEGSDRWENLVAACRLCNNARSAMKAETYLRFVRWKGRIKAARYAHRLRAKLQRREAERRVRAIREAAA